MPARFADFLTAVLGLHFILRGSMSNTIGVLTARLEHALVKSRTTQGIA